MRDVELEQEQEFSDWQASYIRKFMKRYGLMNRKREKPLNRVQRFVARLFGICNPPIEIIYDRRRGIEIWKEEGDVTTPDERI